MLLTDVKEASRVHSVSPVEHTVPTAFTKGKERHYPHLSQSEARHTDEKLLAGDSPEKSQSESWLVKAAEDTTIAPRCRQIVMGRLESEKGRCSRSLVCIDPTQIPIQGVFSARELSRINSGAQEPPETTSEDGQTETQVARNRAYIMLENFSEETLVVPKATLLGVAERIPEPLVDKLNVRGGTDSNAHTPPKPRRKRKNEALYDMLLHGKLDHLCPEEETHRASASNVFHDESTNDFKATEVTEHEILVNSEAPISNPVRAP
jgi:hypothetical protein